MAKTIDGFTQNQTRLAVIIDGLDSCEQDKVLQMLDTVRVCLRCHAQPCIKHLPYNQVILNKSFFTARIAFSVYSTNAKKLLMAQTIHLRCKHKRLILSEHTRFLLLTKWPNKVPHVHSVGRTSPFTSQTSHGCAAVLRVQACSDSSLPAGLMEFPSAKCHYLCIILLCWQITKSAIFPERLQKPSKIPLWHN